MNNRFFLTTASLILATVLVRGQGTAPSTPSTAPATPSTAPSTPSTAPAVPNTAPNTGNQNNSAPNYGNTGNNSGTANGTRPPQDNSTWIAPGSQQNPQQDMNGVNKNPNANNPNNTTPAANNPSQNPYSNPQNTQNGFGNGNNNGITPGGTGFTTNGINPNRPFTNSYQPWTNTTPMTWTNGQTAWKPGVGWTNNASQ